MHILHGPYKTQKRWFIENRCQVHTHHHTAEIKVLRAENIKREESRLFKKAESMPACLPFDEIDQ
jgi:hypothetical protein